MAFGTRISDQDRAQCYWWELTEAPNEPWSLVEPHIGNLRGPTVQDVRPSKKWETAHDNGWSVSFGTTPVVRTGLLRNSDVGVVCSRRRLVLINSILELGRAWKVRQED